ncbi:hypothetical protein [Leuconostoc gelidum]|nr:hypothetical protein [Leuconostoc gelidum]USP17681.1 hypothetical protein J4766_02640 [Leuconostoc gelidum subsp. aenigmaticum]
MVNKFFWYIGIGILIGLVVGYFKKAILELTPIGFLAGFAFYEWSENRK